MSGSPTPYRTGKAEIGGGFIDKAFALIEKKQKMKEKEKKQEAKAARSSGGGGYAFNAKEMSKLLKQSHQQDGERRVQKAAIRDAKTHSNVEAMNKIKAKGGTSVNATIGRKGAVKATFTAAPAAKKPAAKKPAAKPATRVTATPARSAAAAAKTTKATTAAKKPAATKAPAAAKAAPKRGK